MLATAIEYLTENPEVKEKVKEGTASLIGLSQMEQEAVLDILRRPGNFYESPMRYW